MVWDVWDVWGGLELGIVGIIAESSSVKSVKTGFFGHQRSFPFAPGLLRRQDAHVS